MSNIKPANKLKNMIFKTIDGIAFIKYDEIIHLRADRNNTLIFIVGKEEPVKALSNISSLSLKLPQDLFFRCHRSHVINLLHVNSYRHKTREIVMSNDHCIPVSDNSEKKLLQIIQE